MVSTSGEDEVGQGYVGSEAGRAVSGLESDIAVQNAHREKVSRDRREVRELAVSRPASMCLVMF